MDRISWCRMLVRGTCALALLLAPLDAARGADVPGSQDHPALTRYPGSELAWYRVENHMPYRIAVGPVTGYRNIDEWIETEGRVTRIYYTLAGTRTHGEVWKNYRDALSKAGFEIVLEGLDPAKHTDPAGRSWSGVALGANPFNADGAVNQMVAGSATSGGRGVVVARKERPEGTLWLAVHVYQFREDQVSTLVDVVEEAPVETGLVVANAEAIGRELQEDGRVVLGGLFFAHDDARLLPESKPALDEVAKFLAAGDGRYFVVGHTDATGSFDHNRKLSAERAAAVARALVDDYGIDRARLVAHGVGPLAPVAANGSEQGRALNRRVELVEAGPQAAASPSAARP